MGRWLARLKSIGAPLPQATKPTKPPEGGGRTGFVGFVAFPSSPFQIIGAPAAECPRPAPCAGMGDHPDRWCWPHSVAMNTMEICTLTERLALFTDKGASLQNAERLADRLVHRDREGDLRRLCLECTHLYGVSRWRCGRAKRGAMATAELPHELVQVLQRCDSFQAAIATTHSPHMWLKSKQERNADEVDPECWT